MSICVGNEMICHCAQPASNILNTHSALGAGPPSITAPG